MAAENLLTSLRRRYSDRSLYIPEFDLADFLSAIRSFFRRSSSSERRRQPDATDETRERVARIERLVGFSIGDVDVYEQALRHRSLLRRRSDTRIDSNERLEFLGDAVLGVVVADYLYRRFRNENEGFLTRVRAKLVNREALAAAARPTGLGQLVSMSDNMHEKNGRDNQSILADAFEAVIGAVYVDLGFEAARDFVSRHLIDPTDLPHVAEHRDNYKSLLLEHVQGQGWPQPRYSLTGERGPSHDRQFTVEVFVNDRAVGRGTAGSKKKAEQRAAKVALARLVEPDFGTRREISEPES